MDPPDNADKVRYILDLIQKGKDLNINSDEFFHDIEPRNIFPHLNMMLTKRPIIDNFKSETTASQVEVEETIKEIYKDLIDDSNGHINDSHFEIENHINYCQQTLELALPSFYKSLDANHSWMLYWLINSWILIDYDPLPEEITNLAKTKLSLLIVNEGKGGIGGGKGQIGHVASTYAAVLAMVLLEDYHTLNSIRHNLYRYFMSLKQPNGSFIMHEHGEADTRSTYCVLVVSSLLNLLTDELCEGTLEWIKSCQTYEGGFAGIPNTEAHGGYTFCAVASYFLLLDKQDFDHKFTSNLDLNCLVRWLTARQYQLEGGLSGRTNKLVDACYSFWVGGVYAMVESTIDQEIFNRDSLRTYLLNCCQRIQGGFKDKPGKSVDFYHTNYSLLGLGITEHKFRLKETEITGKGTNAFRFKVEEINDDTNTKPLNPVFGLPLGTAEKCREYFTDQI